MPTDNPKTRSRSGPIAALVLAGVLVLYLLSVGPALFIGACGWVPEIAVDFYDPFLYPIYWAADHSDWLRTALNRYTKFWLDLAEDHVRRRKAALGGFP